MANTHNVVKGSSGSHSVVNVAHLRDVLSKAEVHEEGQPEGWYTAVQIYEALKVNRTAGQKIVREACKEGKLELDFKKWIDWDGVNRVHRVFRIVEEK